MKELNDFLKDVNEADDEEKDYWFTVFLVCLVVFTLVFGTLALKFFYGKIVPQAHASYESKEDICANLDHFTNGNEFKGYCL